MNRKQGFTLVELLVVIAIITILAGIVVPRVTDAIGRARMARAVSEIKGADLAITKMLADAEKSSVDKLFNEIDGRPGVNPLAVAALNSPKETAEFYSDVFYELLRRGKDADLSREGLVLQNVVRRKMGTSYMEIGPDPWGTHPYFFYAGPLKTNEFYDDRPTIEPSPFRCYRTIDPEVPYVYDATAKEAEDEILRGNPPVDNALGYPAPKDLTVYIWSYGADEQMNQWIQGQGGGDDVNNWDSQAGWSAFY